MDHDEMTGPVPGAAGRERASLEDKLRGELAEEKDKAERYLANWQRAQADFTNYRKRSDQEKAETVQFASSALILRILPVVDDLERALAAAPENGWAEGVKLIYSKLKGTLKAEGLEEIAASGQPFDALFHEVIMQGEGEEGIVVQEVEKGYKLQGKVLRPAKVIVGKGK